MKCGEWSFTESYARPQNTYTAQGKGFTVTFDSDLYSVVKCVQRVEEIQPMHFYTFEPDIECPVLNYRMWLRWMKSDGEQHSQIYTSPGKRVVAPKGVDHVEIEFLVMSRHRGVFCLKGYELVDQGPYVERNVSICTISHEMLSSWPQRTFQRNVEDAMGSIDIVSKHKPDLVVLTENVFTCNEDRSNNPNGDFTYISLDAPEVKRLCAKAKQYHTYIVCSLKIKDEDGIIHNAGILINREGEMQAVRYKSHLTTGEMTWGIPFDDDYEVYDTDFGRIGILICWEHFFPEAVRLLALQGMEMLVCPTYACRHERAMTRAEENGIYLVTASTWKEGTIIVSQQGRIIATGDHLGYAHKVIDLNDPVVTTGSLSVSGNTLPNGIYLNERRPDLYARLCEQPDHYFR